MDAEIKPIDDDHGQLVLMREWTEKTGILHDSQILQLKTWPLVLTHAIKAETIFNHEDKVVMYLLKETKGKKPKDFAKRLKLLENYTKFLLGDNYRVVVKLEDKFIFGVKNVGKQGSSSARKDGGRRRKGSKRVAKKKGSTHPASSSGKDV